MNNAWSAYELSPDPALPFWEIELRHWDLMFAGGLRATVVASRPAAPLMIDAGCGADRERHLGSVEAARPCVLRGVKNATNRLTEQMADDLRPHDS